MARDILTQNAFVANGSLADPTGTTITPANGAVLNKTKPELIVLRVANTAATPKNVTIKAGPNPPALAGGQGDLVVAITNGTTKWVGPFESGRFIQPTTTDGVVGGGVHVDFESGMTGSCTAFLVPRNT